MITPKQLKARYPYMWAGKNIGISISKGWILIFQDLCDAIDRTLGDDKQGFHWVQVKEKFGCGRFYIGFKSGAQPQRIDVQGPDGVMSFVNKPPHPKSVTEKQALARNAISKLVEDAESKTSKTCICCGSAGHQVNDGWLLTLCDKHEKIHRSKEGLDGIWFDEADS